MKIVPVALSNRSQLASEADLDLTGAAPRQSRTSAASQREAVKKRSSGTF